MVASITIVGLGPGQWSDLTLEAYRVLAQAAAEERAVYFRTLIHPTIERLKVELPGLHCGSFDRFYDESSNWETLYQRIAEEICSLAAEQACIYAVPGNPLIGESSVQHVLALARERNLSTSIVAGLSFMEPVCTALELDPLDAGTQLVDATMLAALGADEVAGKIIPTLPLLVGQVYNRRLASAVKLALGEIYPDEWPVKLVRAASVEADETVVTLPLYELDRSASLANHLSTLYVPPVEEMTALRLVEALEENDMEKLAEELGDLLLQVYLHAEIARQEGDFAIGDVFEHVNAKLIRRHPHVFGQVEVDNAGQVIQNWEVIKRQERIDAGKDVKAESVLEAVPLAAPALIVSQEYQKRAARTGFDFPDVQGALAKLTEELQELQEATTHEQQREEMGDVLFMGAEVARILKIDAEEALRLANRKFRQRFQAMERVIREEGRTFSAYSLEKWIELWRRVKG